MDAVIAKIAVLKRDISRILMEKDNFKFPILIMFQAGMETSKFKLTIEKVEDDFYTDSKGNKWKKVTEEEEING